MEVTKNLHAFIWRDIMSNNCNTYFINGSKKILIDPGHRQLFSHVKEGLSALQVSLDQMDLVIVTHGHPDHVEAVQLFDNPTQVAMSQVDSQFMKEVKNPFLRIAGLDDFEPDFFLQEGRLNVGDETFQVVSTPGHSPGSVCLFWPEQKALFSGDVVFSGGIGRTDFPGGNGKLLKESIQRIAELDVEYLLPGHGEIISGRKAVETNFQMIKDQWFGYLI
ncbi:MAG: MBL fold metallo-hydrolase [Thermodesulfobacteriota bacterium]|nr:MBL fold metallo-hydrolase [Thermodesulfobacteriota bacterium]